MDRVVNIDHWTVSSRQDESQGQAILFTCPQCGDLVDTIDQNDLCPHDKYFMHTPIVTDCMLKGGLLGCAHRVEELDDVFENVIRHPINTKCSEMQLKHYLIMALNLQFIGNTIQTTRLLCHDAFINSDIGWEIDKRSPEEELAYEQECRERRERREREEATENTESEDAAYE
jgi:hypothetical protein